MKGRPVEKTPVKHLTFEELRDVIQEKRKDAKMLERLLFIKFMYKGDSVPQAADKLEVSDVTGYNWLERWDEGGLEGLKPQYSGGPKPKIDAEQKEQLKEMLEKKDYWTTEEALMLVKEKFDVEYSDTQMRRILKELGFKFTRPFQKDYRRPENAEQQLKKGSRKH